MNALHDCKLTTPIIVVRVVRCILLLLAVAFLTPDGICAQYANESGHPVLAYELNGKIVIQGSGWRAKDFRAATGYAPSPSPTGDQVAYLRQGNVYLLRRGSAKIVMLTNNMPVAGGPSDFENRVSWHPTGKWLVYSRATRFEYDERIERFSGLPDEAKGSQKGVLLQTIWIANAQSGKSTLLVGPIGDLPMLQRTSQIAGAQVYEPLFSPDGSCLWFLNGGVLYEATVDTTSLALTGAPRTILRTGTGLDLQSPGASKGGTGAQQLAWDKKEEQLIYWVGRFWGTGVSEYGSVTWHAGKWGRATAINPKFSHAIKEAYPNTEGCAIDETGDLWVSAYLASDHKWHWLRQEFRT